MSTWFRRAEHRGFDVYHAHDGLSGAALAALKRDGLIPGFVRTVHHVDDFADPRLAAWQAESIAEADALMTVSDNWRGRLREDFGRDAVVGGNGVDLDKFSPSPDGRESVLRARWSLGDGPVFLSVGGVEARKNTTGCSPLSTGCSRDCPHARFVVAGGASLLDHGAYSRQFETALAAMGERART